MIAKALYFFGLVSIIVSVYIFTMVDPIFGMYIGLWSPIFFVTAVYEVVRTISVETMETIDGTHRKWRPK
jgi:hypothetical protein